MAEKTTSKEALIRWLALLALLSSCGGPGMTASGEASLAIRVENAVPFDPSIAHGRVERYRVTIEGEGIAEPIVAEFDGEASEGTIENVPTGGDRLVSVTALNANAQSIRAGEAPGVAIHGGTNEVAITLEAVPIFTNLADGNVVDRERLIMRILADPAHPVRIVDEVDAAAVVLADGAEERGCIQMNAATGEGRFVPQPLAHGWHRFTVRDAETGRESAARILLIDGARRPAPLVAAGAVLVEGTGRLR